MTHQRLRFDSRCAENGHTCSARTQMYLSSKEQKQNLLLPFTSRLCLRLSVGLSVGRSVGLSGSVWVCLGLSGSVWVCLGLSWSVWVCLGLSGSVWVCLGLSHVCAQRPHPFRPLRLTSHSSPLAPNRCWRHG